jgi:hypothetical protein
VPRKRGGISGLASRLSRPTNSEGLAMTWTDLLWEIIIDLADLPEDAK